MRKVNWIIGTVSLAVGIGIGIISLAVMSSPAAPSLLSKMHLGSNNTGIITTNQDSPSLPATAPTGSEQEGLPSSHNGEEALSPDPLATTGTGEGADGLSMEGKDVSQDGSGEKVSALLAQQVIGDYKQDIGFFFDAWKATDMTDFRSKLARAYTGELFERHARQAEEYILQGVGLNVSKISFDNVVVEMADANTATLRADYRYTASDFILSEGKSVGIPNEQIVHVRVNLIKNGQRWVITGETGLGATA